MIEWDPVLIFEMYSTDCRYRVQGMGHIDVEGMYPVTSLINAYDAYNCKEWYAEVRSGESWESVESGPGGFGKVYGFIFEALQACRNHASMEES